MIQADLRNMESMKEYIAKGMPNSSTFDAYSDLIQHHSQEGLTSGEDQSASLIEYTRLNAHRTKRIWKTTRIHKKLKDMLQSLSEDQNWFVFTETWCGDAAQNVPVLAKMAEASDKIHLHLLLRDEHPDLMAHFLTNGGKSIPKLAVTNASGEILFTWGPRPAIAQEMVMDWKHSPEPKKPYSEFVIEVQKWYTQDKTASVQTEFVALLESTIPV